MIEKEDLVCRKIDKYETITSMFPLEVSSWSTRDVGIMDLLSGLFAVKQIVKLRPEKGFGWQHTSFLVLLRKPFSSRFPYVFRLPEVIIWRPYC